jgi:hypothetical protein
MDAHRSFYRYLATVGVLMRVVMTHVSSVSIFKTSRCVTALLCSKSKNSQAWVGAQRERVLRADPCTCGDESGVGLLLEEAADHFKVVGSIPGRYNICRLHASSPPYAERLAMMSLTKGAFLQSCTLKHHRKGGRIERSKWAKR